MRHPNQITELARSFPAMPWKLWKRAAGETVWSDGGSYPDRRTLIAACCELERRGFEVKPEFSGKYVG